MTGMREEENRDRVEMMIRRELGGEVMELDGRFREESYPLLEVLGECGVFLLELG